MKTFFLRWLIVFLSVQLATHQAYAINVPYSNKVGAMIANVIAAKVAERATGVAINAAGAGGIADMVAQQVSSPQYQKTVELAGAALTALVTGAATGAGAPFWAVAAIGTVAAVAIPLAVDGTMKWFFNSDGKVTYTPPSGSASPPDSGGAMTAGGAFYSSGGISGGSGENVALAATAEQFPGQTFVAGFYDGSGYYWYWVDDPASAEGHCAPYQHCRSLGFSRQSTGAPASCDAGKVYNASTGCVSPTAGSPVQDQTKSMLDALSDVPEADKTKPANPEIIAAIANKAWQQGAAVGGIPYDPAHPITPADVVAVQSANVTAYPTVGDVLSTSVNPVTGVVSIPVLGTVGGTQTGTATGSVSTTTTGTGSTSTINLTIDWGQFIAPNVDAPSIDSILDPLFNLWPGWKAFAFPAHASTCPTPSFTLPHGVMDGRTIHFDQMCNFLESANTRQAMQAAFAVAWAIVIIFIIMGA